VTSVATFFERQRRRASARIDLAAALLSSGGLRYLFSRGWLLFARLPLRVALHVAEVIVFSDFFELDELGYLLALRSLTVALGALHWGALEPLRQTVRAERARGEHALVELEITRYLRLSLDFCVLILVLLVAGLQLFPSPFGEGFSIIDAYAIGCACRAMIEALTRSYHAGVFAVRRVYRPFAALVAVDLVDVGTALVLWPWLGPWGFAVAQLLGGLVEGALTFVYTRRAYAAARLEPPTLRRALSEDAKPAPGTLRAMLGPALGNLVSQLDALLITALAFSVSQSGLALAAGLHVLRPVLSLGPNWARLFYFDLSRLEGPLQALFRARLERLLLRAAPVFALFTALAGVGIGALLGPATSLLQAVWFLPFLVARFVYAATQVQAFARGNFRALMVGAACVGALAVVLPRLAVAASTLVLLATVTLVAAALAFRLVPSSKRSPDRRADDKLLRPLLFFGQIVKEHAPLQLWVLQVLPGTARASGVARALSAVPQVRWVTRVERRRVLVASNAASLASLISASGGSLRSAQSLDAPTGAQALRQLLQKDLLGSAFEPGAQVASEAELKRAFERDFRQGTLISARSGALSKIAASPRELTATLAELSALAAGSWLSKRRGLRAAVYAPGGEARLVFVAPRACDPKAFADFSRLVFRSSVVAS
jgi:hypothetical protein